MDGNTHLTLSMPSEHKMEVMKAVKVLVQLTHALPMRTTYELNVSNQYSIFSSNSEDSVNDTIASIDSCFSPRIASSPHNQSTSRCRSASSHSSIRGQADDNRRQAGNHNNWRTMTVNCEGIKGKTGLLAATVQYIQPDAIIGCESKLDNTINSTEKFPPGYKVFRKDRTLHGGGVFVAIKDCYQCEELTDLDTEAEIIWVKIHLQGAKSLVTGSYYRPPDKTLEDLECLKESLDKLPAKCRDRTIHLSGDFNLSEINWETRTVLPEAKKTGLCKRLLEIANVFSLTQLQLQPTRGENNLDLFFTTNPSLVKKIQTAPGIGDHHMVITDCDIRPQKAATTKRDVPLFNKANWDGLRADIKESSLDFEKHAAQRSVNANWTTLKGAIMDATKRHVPQKTVKTGSKNLPWATEATRRSIRKKNRLLKKMRKKPSAASKTKYKEQKKKTRRDLYQAHRKYLTDTLNLENRNTFWRYVKSQKNDNNGISPLRQDGKLHTKPREKARILNNQFKSVYTKDQIDDIPTPARDKKPSIEELHISEDKILKHYLKESTQRKPVDQINCPTEC
ncbi:uncharacterized protein LOC135491593 [Lineus longissimus]|uniref:uncharacterized protein LOC135491593 n=1 Tax=Lineus longissimus TaxID=88925 RepID=UPI00315CB61E